MQQCLMRWIALLFFGLCMAAKGWAAASYGMWEAPRHADSFDHFAYVNPDAPKRGELRLVSNLRKSTFDKYNPFTMKGLSLIHI